MPDVTLIDEMEQTADGIYDGLKEQVEALRQRYGDRPLGAEKPDVWQRLEYYLTIADRPDAWAALIEQRAAEVGRYAAIGEALASSVQLEQDLAAHGGWQAVRMHADELMAKRALAAMDRAERAAEKPKLTVRDPLPAAAFTSLLTGEMSGPEPVGASVGGSAPVPPPIPGMGG